VGPPAFGDVNIVNSCGADPTGTNDSAAAIQQCIDQVATGAVGVRAKTIYCPAGRFNTSIPIFLDPPGNLRGADGTNGVSYNGGTTYSQNNTVNSGGIPYISLQNSNTGHTPASSPTFWRPFNWSNATTYAQNDIVRYAGIPWKSLINSNTNNIPTSSGLGTNATWLPTTIAATNVQFSLSLIGDPGIGNGGLQGCTISPGNNLPAALGAQRVGIWIGTGQGMMLKDVNVIYAGTGPASLQNPIGVGVAIAGSSGGANRTLIDNVQVTNEWTAFAIGLNIDGLGAETTWHKVFATNCVVGIITHGTQNDINNVSDSSFGCVQNFIARAGPQHGH
jgi:hypothetical protein